MAICWERAVPFAFHLSCLSFSTVLVVRRVLFPFGVWSRMWSSIVSFPDHCLFSTLKLYMPQGIYIFELPQDAGIHTDVDKFLFVWPSRFFLIFGAGYALG